MDIDEGLRIGRTGQIRLLEQFLHQPQSSDQQLAALTLAELEKRVADLEGRTVAEIRKSQHRPSGRVCTLGRLHCEQLVHQHAVQGFFQSLQNVGHQSPVHDPMIVGHRDMCSAVFVQRTKGQTTGMD